MASEITEEDDEDSYFIINKEAQKEKIRQLIKHQKNRYDSSSSSSWSSSSLPSTSTGLRSSSLSLDQNQNRRLLNLMKKGSTSLRRLFDMEHTSLGNHFDFYCCSPETKTIPLWGSDSDDEIHEDPWTGISKFDRGFAQEHKEQKKNEEHQEDQEHEELKEYVIRKQKLTRKKSFNKLPSFYKFRFSKFFRYRFRFWLRLKSKLRLCNRVWREKRQTKLRKNKSNER